MEHCCNGARIDPYNQGLFRANKKAELTANVYPSGDYSYEWYIDGILSGTTIQLDFNPTSDQVGYHTVKVVATSGSRTYTASKTILVPTGELSFSGMANPDIIRQAPDGGYFILGSTYKVLLPGKETTWVAKFDREFILCWKREFVTEEYKGYFNLYPAPDGGCTLLGLNGEWPSHLLSGMDEKGQIIWNREFKNFEFAGSPDGGFYYINYQLVNSVWKSYLVKVDAGIELLSSDPMMNCSFIDAEDGSLVIVNTYAMEHIPYTRYSGRMVLGRLQTDGVISTYAPVVHDDLSYIANVMRNPYTGGLDIYLSDFYKGYIIQTDANGNL